MTNDYEYYGTYDPDATGDIDLEDGIRDWLWTAGLMFEFISAEKPEILDAFLEKIESKYSNELEKPTLTLSDVDFHKVRDDSSLLSSFPNIKDLCLQIGLKYISLEKGYSLLGEEEPIKYLEILRAKHILLYHRITTLVEILGREDGIQFYKDFVDYWGKELAKKEQITTKYVDLRKSAVKFYIESNAFEFGVVDIDDHQFLAKFDKCVWHESMKHVGDQELAYYAVCYPGPRLGRYYRQNFLVRRTVTLFDNDFCDELCWDRHVHDEPEQPLLEFSSKLVPK